MKVRSFIEDLDFLEPVEVEMTLWPGVPEIIFLGLPDQHMRESAKRIKSAIRAQGFEFPVAQQILVNLKPSHIKKSSRGLELAVACCYLWLTGQVKPPARLEQTVVFGELSLLGEVTLPVEFEYPLAANHILLTGESPATIAFKFYRQGIRCLKDLSSPAKFIAPSSPAALHPRESDHFERVMEYKISTRMARLLEVAAWGEHSVLIAGASGTGKTTFAQMMHAFLPKASLARPFVKPHASTPLISFLGGQRRGELSKAHGGLLCLDEFLEFPSAVIESLREPLQDGFLRVSRLGRVHIHPARFQLVATTNLCPCGDFVPGPGRRSRCRFSLIKCRSYSHKVSGPLLDRFAMMAFTTQESLQTIRTRDIYERVEKLRAKRMASTEPVPNQLRKVSDLEAELHPYFQENQSAWAGRSLRRKAATLQVARTIADLDEQAQILPRHLKEALDFTVHPFTRLQNWDLI